jgi:shikimate dehydrogenase
MTLYGLIGKSLGHSFSQEYFRNKFKELSLTDSDYLNFEFNSIDSFKHWITEHPDIKGLNVTVPYKSEIIPYLDSLDSEAKKIGAVNVINIVKGKLKGYNTDHGGFLNSLKSFIPNYKLKALILGSGGSSRAVDHALESIGVDRYIVSRTPTKNMVSYDTMNHDLISKCQLVVNCTPIGMTPDETTKPDIDTAQLTSDHFVFDLVYNPEFTVLMKEAKSRGASVKNGLEMLHNQAEEAWDIWHS